MIRSAALFFIGMFLLSLMLLPATARSREGHPVSVVEADIYVTKFKATISTKIKAKTQHTHLIIIAEATLGDPRPELASRSPSLRRRGRDSRPAGQAPLHA